MKAVRVHEFGGPEVMRVEDVPDLQPAAGEVLIRVAAAGVNPVETYIRNGNYAFRPDLPYTPGSDGAGVIEELGPGVELYKKGDRVYFFGSKCGSYAELALCSETHIRPLPDDISFSQGAALGIPYGTAYRALFQRGSAQAGETVLVHGASGGVGIAAAQLAAAAGLRVIGTAGSDKGRQLVREQGAEYAVTHDEANDPSLIRRLTGDKGVDLVLEMLANVNLGADLKILSEKGRVVVIGSRGTVEIDPRLTMQRETDIRGMILTKASEDELVEIHAAITAGLRKGTLRPVIGREFKLIDAPMAHETVLSPGASGKIVLVP